MFYALILRAKNRPTRAHRRKRFGAALRLTRAADRTRRPERSRTAGSADASDSARFGPKARSHSAPLPGGVERTKDSDAPGLREACVVCRQPTHACAAPRSNHFTFRKTPV